MTAAQLGDRAGISESQLSCFGVHREPQHLRQTGPASERAPQSGPCRSFCLAYLRQLTAASTLAPRSMTPGAVSGSRTSTTSSSPPSRVATADTAGTRPQSACSPWFPSSSAVTYRNHPLTPCSWESANRGDPSVPSCIGIEGVGFLRGRRHGPRRRRRGQRGWCGRRGLGQPPRRRDRVRARNCVRLQPTCWPAPTDAGFE